MILSVVTSLYLKSSCILSRQFHPIISFSLRQKRLVVVTKTEKINIQLLCSFSLKNIIRHSDKIWAIKRGYWFLGLFRNPARASQLFCEFRKKPLVITRTAAGYAIVPFPIDRLLKFILSYFPCTTKVI